MAFLSTCTRCRLIFANIKHTRTLYISSRGIKNLSTVDKTSSGTEAPRRNVLSQGPSLLAQKMAKQAIEQSDKTHTDKPSETSAELDSLKSRLENLLVEWDSLSPESALPSGVGEDFYETQAVEDSVETIMFPTDIATPAKPSPILGTEDRGIPPSDIPCVGCGVPLQCQHNTFPGFLPSEYFKSLSLAEMKMSICQRCYYIRHCNAFMEVSTEPEEYKHLITKIRPTQSAVVVVVDVMDIPGSIIPNLMDYIGRDHPLIVVGNKADLLSPDCPEYLTHVVEQLRSACYASGLSNIRKVTLISAKTGFGMERLISMLFGLYKRKVDVYIVGTANAGKSSLFNTLLASDYCKSSARNLIERATVSVWPGTTLNLLKFPVMRPSHRVFALRQQRLKQEDAQKKLQSRVERERSKQKNKNDSSWELKEEIKTTDVRSELARDADETGTAWGQSIAGYRFQLDGTVQANTSRQVPEVYDVDQYEQSYWAFDTPGVINPDQVLNLLTPKEMTFFTPASMIVPRSIVLKPRETVFVSGLCRLDLEECDDKIMLAVHCGPNIPIHVVPTNEADDFYEQYIGTKTLGVPIGDKERLARLPALIGKAFEISGEDACIAVADIQFSSVGWVSVAPQRGHCAKLRAYTTGRKGMNLRTPALMPQHLKFKGKRISGTSFYRTKPPGWVMVKAKK